MFRERYLEFQINQIIRKARSRRDRVISGRALYRGVGIGIVLGFLASLTLNLAIAFLWSEKDQEILDQFHRGCPDVGRPLDTEPFID